LPEYIDTHCHLDFDAFEADRAIVISRAGQTGVKRIVNPAVDLTAAHHILALCHQYPNLSMAVGVHPNSATTWQHDTLSQLEDLAGQEQVVAIGEIGLDYYREAAPQAQQQKVFQQQLSLAARLELPVIIHNREATADILDILREWTAGLKAYNPPLWKMPGVLHSFSGDLEAAQRAVGMNFLIGITGPITFKKAAELKLVVQNIAMDRILIETDAPFLTPHPHRGQRNEPAYVVYVAQQIAALKNIPLEQVAAVTTLNAERLFGWSVTV
jgi:TatD DNase family protein